MSEELKVLAEWFEFDHTLGKFVSTGEPIVLPHRETSRMLFITFPSGWVKRCKKYGRMRKPLGANTEYFNDRFGDGVGYKLRWNPTLYKINKGLI